MNPVLFTISGYSIGTLFAMSLVFIFVFIAVFWMVSRKDLKNDTIYDIAFITVGFGFFISRVVAFLGSIGTYLDQGWSLLPISEVESQTLLLEQLPWSFFAINDGGFSYIGLIIGLILGIVFIYLNSNRSKSILLLFDRIVLAYTISSVFLFLGLMLAGVDMGNVTDNSAFDFVKYADGLTRIPIQVFQIVFMFVLFILFIVIRKKTKRSGVIAFFFLIAVGLFELILRVNVAGYEKTIFNSFDLYQLLALSVLFFGVLLGVNVYQLNIIKTRIDDDLKSRDSVKTKELGIGRSNERGSTSRFAMSYANRKNEFEAEFTSREKVSKRINSIKRKLSK